MLKEIFKELYEIGCIPNNWENDKKTNDMILSIIKENLEDYIEKCADVIEEKILNDEDWLSNINKYIIDVLKSNI